MKMRRSTLGRVVRGNAGFPGLFFLPAMLFFSHYGGQAGVIPPHAIGLPTTIIERTKALDIAPAGTIEINVQDDGFIVGADISVDGEASEIANVSPGKIILSSPLTQDHTNSPPEIVQMPVFQELSVSSSLTVKAKSQTPPFTIGVIGNLTIGEAGVVIPEKTPGAPSSHTAAIRFSVSGSIAIQGEVESNPKVNLILEGNQGVSVTGQLVGPGGLRLRSSAGAVTVEGDMSSLLGVTLSAHLDVSVNTALTPYYFLAIENTGGDAKLGNLLIQGPETSGFASFRDIGGSVTAGNIQILQNGGFISFNRIGGDVQVGTLEAGVVRGSEESFITADFVGGMFSSSGNIQVRGDGSFINIRNVNERFSAGSLTVAEDSGFLNMSDIDVVVVGPVSVGITNGPNGGFQNFANINDFKAGPITCSGTNGFINFSRIKTSATVTNISAPDDGGYVNFQDIANVAVGAIDAGVNSGQYAGTFYCQRVTNFLSTNIVVKGDNSLISITGGSNLVTGGLLATNGIGSSIVVADFKVETLPETVVTVNGPLQASGDISISNITGDVVIRNRFWGMRSNTLSDIQGNILLNFANRKGPNENGSFKVDLPGKNLTVITHGWEGSVTNNFTGEPAVWTKEMQSSVFAYALNRNLTNSIIVTYNWEGAYSFNNPHHSRARCPDAGVILGEILRGFLTNSNVDIHFIGHSHGTIVNAYAASKLVSSNLQVKHFTILDCAYFLLGEDVQIFRRLLANNVSWVDNYFGDRPNFIPKPSFGICIPGAYNRQVPGDHSEVREWYAATIVEGSNKGFYWSEIGGGFGDLSAAEAFPWNPTLNGTTECPALTPLLRVFQLPFAILWSGINAAFSGTSLLLTEHSPASAIADLTIPLDAQYLSFDFNWTNPGDGDSLRAELGNTILGDFTGLNFSGTNFWSSGLLNVEEMAGQTLPLRFVLDSVGATNAQVIVENLSFYGTNPPQPIVLTMSTETNNCAVSWKGGTPPYVLEQADTLPSNSWNPVSTTGVSKVTLPMEANGRFFRVIGQ